jgi:hypothetical protein
MKKVNGLPIRNGTGEFLIFTRQAGEDGLRRTDSIRYSTGFQR